MANQVEQEFYLTRFTNANGVLTKELSMEHGKITSIAPKMATGIAERVKLTLSQLPDFIAGLEPNQCFAPGIMDTEHERVEVLTLKEFERRGYDYPVHVDATGVYGTRSARSMTQKGPSLIFFDHDTDEFAKVKVETPEDFLQHLDKAAPELGILNTSYVRTYSTSTSLFDKRSHEVIRPADGFHIYMLVKHGQDIDRFSEQLEKRCWMAGLGHIKVASNGSRLPRTVFDTAVHQPERLCFEAGAYIKESETFYQNLPKGELKTPGNELLQTRKLLSLKPNEEKEFMRTIELERNSEAVIQRVEQYREIKIDRLVHSSHYTEGRMERKEAETIVRAHENLILHPQDILEFEDGRETSVLEAFLNPMLYDQAQLKDPLRPEKGPSKAKFYANQGQYGGYNPTIHSFVSGERNFELREAIEMFMRKNTTTESGLEIYDPKATVINERYFPEIKLRPGVTLIKGEKGTGKTEMVRKEVVGFEGRVIGICHLVSLVNVSSEKFELADYNEVENEQIHTLRMQKRLGICLNSLYKVQGQTYDMVILDELCQLLRAIKAQTVDKPAACLKALRDIIAHAKYVVCMDADLSKEFIDMMRDDEYGIVSKNTELHVVVNEYKPAAAQARQATFYQDPDGRADHVAFNETLTNWGLEKGLFYASNSRKDVIKKASLLITKLGGDGELEQEHFITECEGRRVITVTSNNSQTEEVQRFIRNINDNLRSDDIFMASPSMGTGHSIDAVAGSPIFERTFCYFTKMAGNLPSDCAQHMSRVRECSEFHIVYMDNSRRYPTAPLEIVQKDIYGNRNTIDNKLNVKFLSEYDFATERLRINDHGWADWYGQLKSFENNQLNEFSKTFIDGLKREGYIINNMYDLATADGRELNTLMKELSDQIREVEKTKLRETELISDEEYEVLESQTHKSSEEQRQLLKKRQSRLFGLDAGEDLNELITMSTQALNGRRNALMLGANNDTLFMLDMMNRVDTKRADKDKTAFSDRQALARGFLFFFGISFMNDVPSYDGREITAPVKHMAFDYLLNNRRDLDVLMHIKVPLCDTDKKREDFVRRVLTSLGLKFHRVRRRTIRGLEYEFYLDNTRVERMREDILTAREKSQSSMFTGIEDIPGNLKAYVFQYKAGTPEISELHSYMSKLDPNVRLRLVSLLEEQIFKTFKAVS